MNETDRILWLREELHRHNYNYYVNNAPEIPDQEFDQLMAELQALESLHPEMADPNSPTARVGSDLGGEFRQIKHAYPMLSLGNTYNREEVQAFYQRVTEALGTSPLPDICCELKYDGLSISLTYEDGKLLHAVTRGDGVQGDDVTDNVRTIRSIPLMLPPGTGWPARFEIRGEILMPWSSFEQLNREREAREEPLFANPRNAASGTLKSKNSSVVAHRKLDAYFYQVLSDETQESGHYQSVQQAARWGFKTSEAMRIAHSLEDIYSYIDHWDTERKKLPVATDGIVLKVNDRKSQQLLGSTAKSPRWAIAYKFQAERACTPLREVTFQVGRTGAVTPVANMEPVLLAGTVVKRASLHNEDIIRQLDLHIGDMVYVEKAGEIIPQIVGVATDQRSASLGAKVEFIKTCPECGAPLVRYEGEAAHYCPNDTACPPQLKGRIEHYISREAMNIESLGPETVDEYFERGLIRDAADLYHIKLTDICGADRTRERSARKIIDSIAASRDVPFERVLFALGIRFVGKVAARSLARHFKSMAALQAATPEELQETEGIGKTIAQSLHDFLHNPSALQFIDRLAEAGVQMEAEETQQASQALAGKSIVVSGTFSQHSREEYKALIEAHGGKNVGSISGKTSFILAGENMGPSKLEKAKKLGIPIVSEESFLQMLPEAEQAEA